VTNSISIAGHAIQPGSSVTIDLPMVRLYTDTDISVPVHIKCARKHGPTLFVSAAVHGDEINGIEIVRRLLRLKSLKLSRGTLILLPMVNVYGVLNRSRYMPDRRDLNRCFPGYENGSLAAIVADKFISEIVEQCDYGVDLHTGAIHRSNLPQIRADLSDKMTQALAHAFGVPVILNSSPREGTLRHAAQEVNTQVLLYEAGEALRFDELSILAGVRGVMRVLHHLDMVKKKPTKIKAQPVIANTSRWKRAPNSGIVHSHAKLGDHVQPGDVLAEIGSPLGEVFGEIISDKSAIVIGKQNIPLVQKGEAMYHLAYFSQDEQEIAENIKDMADVLLPSS